MAATATPGTEGMGPCSHPGMAPPPSPDGATRHSLPGCRDTAATQGPLSPPWVVGASSTGHPTSASTSRCSPGCPRWCHQHLLLCPLSSAQHQCHLASSTGLGRPQPVEGPPIFAVPLACLVSHFQAMHY